MAHSDAFVRQRRRLLLGATALGAAGALAWLRPEARRDGHNLYFRALDVPLTEACPFYTFDPADARSRV